MAWCVVTESQPSRPARLRPGALQVVRSRAVDFCTGVSMSGVIAGSPDIRAAAAGLPDSTATVRHVIAGLDALRVGDPAAEIALGVGQCAGGDREAAAEVGQVGRDLSGGGGAREWCGRRRRRCSGTPAGRAA